MNPDKSFAWIHVDDLAAAIAGLAVGEYAAGDDPEQGPVEGGCTPVNISAEHATQGDYLGAVGSTLGNEPTWTDEDPGPAGCATTARAAGAGSRRT